MKRNYCHYGSVKVICRYLDVPSADLKTGNTTVRRLLHVFRNCYAAKLCCALRNESEFSFFCHFFRENTVISKWQRAMQGL